MVVGIKYNITRSELSDAEVPPNHEIAHGKVGSRHIYVCISTPHRHLGLQAFLESGECRGEEQEDLEPDELEQEVER